MTNYKQAVQERYPEAKCYCSGSLIGLAKCYHVGVPEGNEIKTLLPKGLFRGSRNAAWKAAYQYLMKIKINEMEKQTTKTGIELIAEERQEQINKHGWDATHDGLHDRDELAIVAATLAVMDTDARVIDTGEEYGSYSNPWGLEEKLKDDKIHRLKVAGALIAAEIDRIQLLKKR